MGLAQDRNDLFTNLWLDKLWQALFDDGEGGLLSPGQIRREHRNRHTIRAAEMAAIIEAEQEIQLIHSGRKQLDETGAIVDSIDVSDIQTFSIIEQPEEILSEEIQINSAERMLRSASQDLKLRELEHSLVIRKLALLAEAEILKQSDCIVSRRLVDPDWLQLWRHHAQSQRHDAMQKLWVSMLIRELANPGQIPASLFTFIAKLSPLDLNHIGNAAKLVITDFIYDASGGYFELNLHTPMINRLREIGVIAPDGVAQDHKIFNTERDSLLVCGSKAIQFSSPSSEPISFRLSVFAITSEGQMIFDLVNSKPDIAYLHQLGKTIKQSGCLVSLGDWYPSETLEKRFIPRITV